MTFSVSKFVKKTKYRAAKLITVNYCIFQWFENKDNSPVYNTS